ncbi:MAG: pyrroline-5-carboxylate reductase [Persicimonas sp.]
MQETDTQKSLEDFEVVLIGCGKMGGALAEGAVESGSLEPSQLVLIDRDAARVDALAERLDAVSGPVERDDDTPRLWIVAVKPKDVSEAIAAHRSHFAPGDLLVSIAAGVDLDTLRADCGDEIALARAMPNTPALVGRGVTGLMGQGEADIAAAVELFEGVGSVVVLDDERHFDPLTAVSGSGPAYVFVALEALADGAVAMGLPRKAARELALQTVAGAAALVEAQPDKHTAELKDAVASPGGTTIAGLAALEEHGFRRALIGAVEAAAQRSREMGEK